MYVPDIFLFQPHAEYASKGKKLASGILFAVLLNFKHIYMYLAVCIMATGSFKR